MSGSNYSTIDRIEQPSNRIKNRYRIENDLPIARWKILLAANNRLKSEKRDITESVEWLEFRDDIARKQEQSSF